MLGLFPEIFFSSERFIRETVSIISEKRIIAKESIPSRITSLVVSYLISPNVLLFGLSLRLVTLAYPSPDLAVSIDLLASLILLGATVKFKNFLLAFSDSEYSDAQPGFIGAALRGDEKAGVLISTLEGPNTHLSEEEVWIKRAFNGDYLFNNEGFYKLNKCLKRKIYFVANAFGNRKLVEKLKSLGMASDPVFGSGPHILAYNMDIISADKTIKNWLKQLRTKGLLLTEAEFNGKNQKSFLSKGNDISRIYGRDFVQKLILDHGLKYIKVPKKIAVIKDKTENLSISIHPWFADLLADEAQVKVYAEYIEGEERKLKLEEALEYMLILEKTGYNDFCGRNFIFAKDGIYFIDTESKDFTPEDPSFNAIGSIKNFLNPEDIEEFLKAFKERKEIFLSNKSTLEESEKKYHRFFQKPYKNLVGGYRHLKFTFATTSLLT